MAMGKRSSKQAPMFDRFAEEQCQRFYAPVMGLAG